MARCFSGASLLTLGLTGSGSDQTAATAEVKAITYTSAGGFISTPKEIPCAKRTDGKCPPGGGHGFGCATAGDGSRGTGSIGGRFAFLEGGDMAKKKVKERKARCDFCDKIRLVHGVSGDMACRDCCVKGCLKRES